MTHWATSYIGLPWIAGISDCWSFARGIWRLRWGWDVPALTVDPADAREARKAFQLPPESAGWVRVTDPKEGDAVLMARGERTCHVGIWVETSPAAGVLHSLERSGVVFTPPDRLAGMGYRVVGMYRRAE